MVQDQAQMIMQAGSNDKERHYKELRYATQILKENE